MGSPGAASGQKLLEVVGGDRVPKFAKGGGGADPGAMHGRVMLGVGRSGLEEVHNLVPVTVALGFRFPQFRLPDLPCLVPDQARQPPIEVIAQSVVLVPGSADAVQDFMAKAHLLLGFVLTVYVVVALGFQFLHLEDKGMVRRSEFFEFFEFFYFIGHGYLG
jgi:hypothetical protein